MLKGYFFSSLSYISFFFFFPPDRFNAIIGVFFSFSLFDVRSYVSYKDFHMGDLKTIERGLGFRFCIFSLFWSGVVILGLGCLRKRYQPFWVSL